MSNLIQDKYLHKATFSPTSTQFEAVFGAVTPGLYDFSNTPACVNVPTLELQPGYIYWIKTISVVGNLPEEDYLGSISIFPLLRFRRLLNPRVSLYSFPYQVGKFIDGADFNAWIVSDQRSDYLTLTMEGACIQLPSMIGLASMRIIVSLNVYGICDKGFSEDFRGEICRCL